MPSPVHFRTHNQPHAYVMGWLGIYAALTSRVELGDSATILLDINNEVQPDALLGLDKKEGIGHELTNGIM